MNFFIHDNPRDYEGEVHEADCPIRPYVESLRVLATGQPSLFEAQVLVADRVVEVAV